MNRKIDRVLTEMVNKKKSLLNESIKIFKTDEVSDRKRGKGYWIYASSDSSDPDVYSYENKNFFHEMKLDVDRYSEWKSERGTMQRPEHVKTNVGQGQWGWGYFVMKNRSPEEIKKYISNLREITREYNMKKNLEQDKASGELTVKQIKQIQNLTGEIKDSIIREMNEETKAKLEAYLDELALAVENDEVFDFLTEKYQEASDFVSKNKAAGHNYTISNSMIILAADPNASIAGQFAFWAGRNYAIKPQYEHGITIYIPNATNTKKTAEKLKYNKKELDNYKKTKGIDPSKGFNDIRKENPLKHDTDMAYHAIDSKATRTGFGSFNFGVVYTDNMVEPMPGKEVPSIEDLMGTAYDIDGELHISQKELGSGEHIDKLKTVFNAVISVAQENNVNIPKISLKRDSINDFNRVLGAISYNRFKNKNAKAIGGENMDEDTLDEMLNGYSEVISNLVKRNYGLPSEASKYNAARQGIDREEIQRMYKSVVDIAHGIIEDVNKKMSEPEPDSKSINEVRRLVRSILRK